VTIFTFLKYIQPGWYFSLPPKTNGVPAAVSFPTDIAPDPAYRSPQARLADAAYQAWHKGYLNTTNDTASTATDLPDNYRFVRKYFHPMWSWYVLGMRLFTLRNPLREIPAFFKNRRVKRIALYNQVFPHEEKYQSFESELVAAQPFISVIIPTLNRYPYLKDVLEDLEKQDHQNFEVIVVDQSEPFQANFYDRFKLDLKLVRQEEKALWLARNTAVKMAKADYLLLYDDDSRVETDWITQHLKCLDYFQADISSGVSISVVGAPVPENYRFFRWADQLDTGNVMLRRRVFEMIGLFDRQFEKQRMGDGEYGLRAYLAGFKNISNPHAKRLHLKVGEGGLRQMGSWDAFRPKSWLAPRPVPSVVYLYRKYFGTEIAINAIILGVLPSLLPYRFKKNHYLIPLGGLLAVVALPLVLVQVLRSWRLASEKLRQGAKIESLTA
jgi:hypothetical protein